ncbi:hypothetical protein NMG60_11026481 [Bertholletia excelsa]
MEQLKPSLANSCPMTPLIFLERAATAYGDSPSVIHDATTYTWSQTHLRCLRLASSITSLGVGRGHVVSVVSPNTPAMYELHFAVPMAGAVLNNVNIRLDAHAVSVILSHAESKLVFVDYHYKYLVIQAISMFPDSVPPPKLVFIMEDAGDEFFDRYETYEGLVKKGDPGFNWVRPETELEPIVLNYTSGTTSAPKGVVHSHRGVFLMTLDSLVDWSVPKSPVYLWTLPMFHSNGWTFTWGMAAIGGTNVCLRKIDAAAVYSAIQQHGVTHMCGAPVVLHMLCKFGGAGPLPQPVHFLVAGASPPVNVLLRAETLGFVVSHGFGMTELSGVVISCAWKRKWDRLPMKERGRLRARQGVRTAGTTEVDVVDPLTGAPVKRDGMTRGEIVIRGGSVMLGYLKDPEATSRCLKEDGWLYTGDVAVMHPDGYLEIKGRSKDIIITGGENVSSVEVEAVICTHPAVDEVAVVARPDEFWGETPCAFVSLRREVEKQPTEKDVIEFCRERLPRYMVPRTVVFQKELPKTSTGKIQKTDLRHHAKAMGPLLSRL